MFPSISHSNPALAADHTHQPAQPAPNETAGASHPPASSTPAPRMENRSSLQSSLVAQMRASASNPAANTKQATAMINFLREHGGQLDYRPENYPDTSGWHKNKLMAGVRNVFASSKAEEVPVNCWGAVFYTQYKAGMVDKSDLEKRASANTAANEGIDRHQGTLMTAAALRADLIGNAELHPAESFDFGQVPPGSTVLFCRQHPNQERFPGQLLNSHAAVMLDQGQMAHIAQAPTSVLARTRPALINGKLEITTPDQVLALATEMANPMGVLIGHTNGPASFVKENLQPR